MMLCCGRPYLRDGSAVPRAAKPALTVGIQADRFGANPRRQCRRDQKGTLTILSGSCKPALRRHEDFLQQ